MTVCHTYVLYPCAVTDVAPRTQALSGLVEKSIAGLKSLVSSLAKRKASTTTLDQQQLKVTDPHPRR